MSEISPETLSDRLQSDDKPLVLDIRHEDEYEDWHIPGSENIPIYEDLKNDREEARDSLTDIPEDQEVVTVCAAGVLSQDATELLRDLGYNAKTLVDGMNGWSRVHRSAPVGLDLDGTLVQVARPGKGCLSQVLISNGVAAVFDPSQYLREYEAVLDEYEVDLVGVFDSHGHADHVSGGQKLAEGHGVPYYLHPEDARGLEVTPLADGQSLDIGEVEITVMHTPGHSPGSVTFLIEDEALLTGDTLFHDSVGRVELGVQAGIEDVDVEENAELLYESLEALRAVNGDPLVLPAHDPGSPEPPVTARLSEVVHRNSDLGRPRQEFVDSLSSDIPEHPPNFQRVKRINMGTGTAPEDELSELEVGPNRCAAE